MRNSMESGSLTRRSFIKTGAVAAGAAALAGLAACSEQEAAPETDEESAPEQVEPSEPAQESEQPTQEAEPVAEERFFNSCMGNCSGWGCPCYLTIREGKVANIEPARLTCPDGTPNPYQGTCAKGYANISRMYSDKRVLYPMKRTGERGSGEFERISWDQAVQEITDKWKEIIANNGPDAIAFYSGSGNGGASAGYPTRLKTLMGASTLSSSYDWTGMFCQWNHAGFHNLLSGHNEMRDIPNADNLFVWGTNPTESAIADFHELTDALDNGAKLIVIDPIFTTTAAKADLYVPIHPCTDGLLAAGIAQISLRDGHMDKQTLQTLTVGPFLVKEDGMYLRTSDLGQAEAGAEDDLICVWDNGAPAPFATAADPEVEGEFEVDGIGKVKPAAQILIDRFNEWDLETISEITEVPMETIEELARIWNSGKSYIWTGYGCDHYSNGQTAYEGFFGLCDLTGQIGKHGAGISCSDFSSPTAQVSPGGMMIGLGTEAADLVDFVPGPTVNPPHFHTLMQEGSVGPLTQPFKSLFVYYGNPISTSTDRQNWLKSIEKMDMIVTADPFMSETAQYSDYILPVAFLYERNDIYYSFNPYVKYAEKAVDPLGEALDDFEVTKKLGIGMGYEDYFTQSFEEFLTMSLDNDVAKASGITLDRLKEEHAIWSYPEEPVVKGLNTGIYTATGRFEFYHEGIQPEFNVGQEWDMQKESCWFWEPPLEAWPTTRGSFEANPLASKYPFLLISERCKFKTHTMFNNAPLLRELDPEPYIKLNPEDAAAMGVAEGDTIRVSNDRGYVVIKAVLNAGVRPGMMVIDHGWERDDYIEGHYSDLSSCQSWPRFEQNNWFDCLVAVEKVS